jgi:cytidylate kinase
MPAVTISAGYGTGGSGIARLVADDLGLPLLDRAISAEVAAELHVSVPEAEDAAFSRSFADRFFGLLTPLASGVLGAGTDAAPPEAATAPTEADLFRERAEQIMREAIVTGAVILGRAGSAAFRNEPGVLRVRLFGPKPARVAHACRTQNTDSGTAEKRLAQVDTARAQYVRRLYGCDIDDPALYHLQIDSTALSEAACVQLIAAAYRAFCDDRG